MRVKIDGGHISAERTKDGKIGITIGCNHFNADGTRKDTVINTAIITEEQLVQVFSDVFENDSVEEETEDGYTK